MFTENIQPQKGLNSIPKAGHWVPEVTSVTGNDYNMQHGLVFT